MAGDRSVANYCESGTGRSMTTDSVGAPNGTGVTAVEYGNGGTIHRTVLTLYSVSLTITDATTSGAHGSLKVYDFPAGHVLIHGALMNLTTLAGAGGLADTAAVVGSVGSATTATDNATLTTTEANIIASTAGTLVGGAGVLVNTASIVPAPFDGTVTPLDAYLNVAIPDAGSSASDTLTVNGTITLFWSLGG